MSIFTLYLLTILDGIDVITFLGALMGILFGGGALFMYLVESASVYKDEASLAIAKKAKSILIPIGIISLLLHVLIPTTDQAIKIVGGYYVTNLEDIDKLPKNAINAANQFLESYAEPVKEDAK